MSANAELNREIGAALRAARLSRGVTQEDLARALGVDRTTITRYERGSKTIAAATLLRAMRVLQTPVSVFQLPEAGPPRPDAQLPIGIARIVELLGAHPEFVPAVEQVLATFLERPEKPA